MSGMRIHRFYRSDEEAREVMAEHDAMERALMDEMYPVIDREAEQDRAEVEAVQAAHDEEYGPEVQG